ncbi:hypothetical protein SAMN05444336_101955 [Albimonas donghaensis]|uniref:Uncharacterized protein n=1 Tax=Albimonas donghaensis TaxID=356660 RepID=A0A1H2TCK5_9RHOB|nr:hypothetical protein [Albimonas donghaensis]SDW41693.1 hypothetical protein SAMN05444336_101955 [Albimonas donghaensis]
MTALLTGFAIGCFFAVTHRTSELIGLSRLNQGLVTSAGLAALVAACLWLDGWILAAIAGFVVGLSAILAVSSARR